MKKILLYTVLFGLLCCSREDASAPGKQDLSAAFPTKAEAKEQFNGSNFGIYKGIIVGTSGTVYLNLNNNGEATARITINGQATEFTTAETIRHMRDTKNLTFISGKSSFDFSVSAKGQNPRISNLHINGHHTLNTEVIKEYSDAPVQCYLGTYGNGSGSINFLQIENSFYGLLRPADDINSYWIEGEVKPSGEIGGTIDGGSIFGKAENVVKSGALVFKSDDNLKWKAIRAM